MGRWRALVSTTAFRWTLTIAAGFSFMALLLFSFIYWQTAVSEQRRIDAVVTREMLLLVQTPPLLVDDTLARWLKEDRHDVRYAGVFGPEGQFLAGNLLTMPNGVALDGKVHRAVLIGVDRDHDGDDPEVVRAAASTLPDRRVLVVGYDIDELEAVNDVILRALGLGLVPTVLLSLASGFVLAERARRRIASLHQAVARIMGGQLSERLPVSGSGDDTDQLLTAMNTKLAEIERLMVEIRNVGDNIAHDLRTPLTRIRTSLERARDEAQTSAASQDILDRSIASVDKALVILAAVLRVGEIEYGRRRSGFALIDLGDVARDAFELYEPLAEERGLILRQRLNCATPVLGDRDLLLEATGNLLDNAFKFAPPGSEVLLATDGSPGTVSLSVIDRGPGISPEQRELVQARFYRVEQSRTVEGGGLGLSIVAAIVHLHGFQLELNDAAPGCIVSINT